MARQKKIRLPSATFVVARSSPGMVIGCDNQLPWHLPSDLKRFKAITSHHVVLMGRKTLESIGRPLPNRLNVVLTRSPQQPIQGVVWANSVEDAIFIADYHTILLGRNEFFVVGGAEIYEILSDRKVFNKIYLTEVFCHVEGSAKFTHQFDRREWKLVEEEDIPRQEGDEYPYRNTTWERRDKTIRYGFISDFMTHIPNADEATRRRLEELAEEYPEQEDRIATPIQVPMFA